MQLEAIVRADNPAWDPRYHGSIMMAPVLYCACLMAIVAATFGLFLGLRLWQYRVAKRPFRAHHAEPHDEEEVGQLRNVQLIFKPWDSLSAGFGAAWMASLHRCQEALQPPSLSI